MAPLPVFWVSDCKKLISFDHARRICKRIKLIVQEWRFLITQNRSCKFWLIRYYQVLHYVDEVRSSVGKTDKKSYWNANPHNFDCRVYYLLGMCFNSEIAISSSTHRAH